MSASNRHHLAPGVSAESLLNTLIAELGAECDGPTRVQRTLLDTFDWLIFRSGHVLTHEVGNPADPASLRLLDRESGAVVAAARLPPPSQNADATSKRPARPSDLPPGALRDSVAAAITVRAMLPRVECTSSRRRGVVRNQDGKTVLRLWVDTEIRARCPHRDAIPDAPTHTMQLEASVRIDSMRGYEEIHETARKTLTEARLLGSACPDPLLSGLRALDVNPEVEGANATYALERKHSVGPCFQHIFRVLLATLRRHEPGMRHAVDIEFLHDYRVTVRRMRSALALFRRALEPEFVTRMASELKWLGTETTPARDLDVYLEMLPDYERRLGSSDLNALRTVLETRRTEAYERIARMLEAARYTRLLDGLEHALREPGALCIDESRTVGEFADHRISRTVRRILRDGRAIDASTPAEALHELRKVGKKLRYGLEFFRVLYPSADVRSLIRALKKLQDNLGAHQDAEVQADFLREIGPQTAAAATDSAQAAATLLSMGSLIARLEEEQRAAREEFGERFASFDTKPVRDLARRLFGKACLP